MNGGDPRRIALLRGFSDIHTGRVWDAVFRDRLAHLSDDQIKEIAASPMAHQWLGYNRCRELAIALWRRRLGWECLPVGFILEPPEATM
jgi:hypothetical protein